ncbi:MAG: FAD-dependent oxidoreductase [Rhodobacteraceae bacterium]|nr:FAD-dependent oxidoreductase [Paracoccaceae bacterium]
MVEEFPNLFAPISFGSITLPNRFVMGSMHTGIERTGDWNRAAEFYAERVRGGVKLIITGGIAPNHEGAVFPGAPGLFSQNDIAGHRIVTNRVHDHGGSIAMQILHAGRYAHGKDCVAPSAIRSPISKFSPLELDNAGVEKQINDMVDTACRAREAGYDGVEIMGSEGYFINQFLVGRTNRRTDRWGGCFENRMRLPTETVARTRRAVGADFLVIYRISVIDLVPDGSSWDEVAHLARAVETAGADLLNSGIGWHESRIPTIATCVPRMAFAWVTRKLKQSVSIPVVATNRINSPETAERILAEDCSDLVSMARPFLADAEFVNKAASGRQRTIAPCIACNQACLDHTFEDKIATCMVNPRACNETEFRLERTGQPKSIAVIGAGPAGLAAALTAAERGHSVVLHEGTGKIGGQLNMALRIPGKEEFSGLVDWFETMLGERGVKLQLLSRPSPEDLVEHDEIIVATGVRPRLPGIPGQDGPNVLNYCDVLSKQKLVGNNAVIVGGGGIAVDVAEFLSRDGKGSTEDLPEWLSEWGITDPENQRGGLDPSGPSPEIPSRCVTIVQRSTGAAGRNLGRTTRWIHRSSLRLRKVEVVGGAAFKHIAAEGVYITESRGDSRLVPADTVVLCTGQEPENLLAGQLRKSGRVPHVIGGAQSTNGIDAKRAIDQGTRLAAAL